MSTGPRRLPHASLTDTVQIVGTVVLPTLARGVIVRRPPVVAKAEKLDADRRAVELLQRMRRRYGRGPLRLRLPRRMVVLLDPTHVQRVLDQTPEPFTPASAEKRAALGHFQPHGVLISTGAERDDRRRFNEEVLDTTSPVHRSADVMVGRVQDEVDQLLTRARRDGALVWDDYSTMWDRMVRRVVLGDGAKDDEELTELLVRLRATANWAFLHPRRVRTRARFLDRLAEHVDRAEPGSLAASMAGTPTTDMTEPGQQPPQWMFAFDAAAWASFRALALLHAFPEQMARAREEIAGRDLSTPQDLSFLRACILESLRLWATTPAVLRESTERTLWEDGPMPESTSILTYAPLFHRDDENLPYANEFDPDVWLDPAKARDWPLIPFSAGPAECPGRNLVLHVSSSILAMILAGTELRLEDEDRLHPLPSVLDPFSLRFPVVG
ncbi:cytochrome P450 [Cellulomonas bogoriensis]|uniref:Cytochrome P450 n=1 Tax=Cellulomonas bogoriensis 69B4 = DSM 16987 TaxID=1386082 RepID=A0A0A0C403_9CELL|nr:cytochrome P450 [Cellulomonas bogoriensis]KGM14109.1 cytochrome P450 [Cellulomonas bogoriensis 69B4 = DSM 16987]